MLCVVLQLTPASYWKQQQQLHARQLLTLRLQRHCSSKGATSCLCSLDWCLAHMWLHLQVALAPEHALWLLHVHGGGLAHPAFVLKMCYTLCCIAGCDWRAACSTPVCCLCFACCCEVHELLLRKQKLQCGAASADAAARCCCGWPLLSGCIAQS